MKNAFVFISILLSSLYATSQAVKEVVIVACKNGTLFIDGTAAGNLETNDATKQTLTIGEHYLQLKTADAKFNQTVIITTDSKGIIRLGCNTEVKKAGIRLIDKVMSLSGVLAEQVEQNIFGLDAGDEIELNCAILNKKGTATIILSEYNTKREIYRKEGFSAIVNEKIRIPVKGVYFINLISEALFDKNVKLTIDRIPAVGSDPYFKTAVKWLYDTTSVEVLSTLTRVYSVSNPDHPNKTGIMINLPANTAYWTYWLGVGKEAQDKMKSFTTALSAVQGLISLNPLALFGMKLIPNLPMMNTPATVSYKFMDTDNFKAYQNAQAYSYYKFKQADNITTDYALIKPGYRDLMLALVNNSTMEGQNVEIRVVAFTINARLVVQD